VPISHPPFRFGRFRVAALATVVVLALVAGTPTPAADDKVLQRVKGVVGYEPTTSAPLTPIVAKFALPDDYLAITREKSAALLTLPDSSIVGLGENTDVQVGAFNQTAAGPGSTITVNGGTLRFDIRRPQGGTANYRFVTTTSQTAVRGTVGLISVFGGNTTVACLVCAADSVSVTVGTQTFTLLSGQMLTVSAAGAVVTGTITGSVLGGFSAAGVSTSTVTGTAAATAGVVGASSAGTLIGAGAVGAAIAGVAISNATRSTPTPQPSPTPTATPTPNPSPTPSASPTPSPSPTSSSSPTPIPTPTATSSATFSITGKTRAADASRLPDVPPPSRRQP